RGDHRLRHASPPGADPAAGAGHRRPGGRVAHARAFARDRRRPAQCPTGRTAGQAYSLRRHSGGIRAGRHRLPRRLNAMREMLPREAYQFLAENPEALFIDCRSDAEFYFVGHPVGANHVAWQDGPDWDVNPHFVGEVRMLAGNSTDRPVVLICRSGRRSAVAAQALEAAGFSDTLNGWRHDGLPWEQLSRSRVSRPDPAFRWMTVKFPYHRGLAATVGS